MPRPNTFLAAAIEVLRASGRPMTTREITDEALSRGLITTTGKTPDATMSASLYAAANRGGEIRRVSEPGPNRAVRGSVRWALPPASG